MGELRLASAAISANASWAAGRRDDSRTDIPFARSRMPMSWSSVRLCTSNATPSPSARSAITARRLKHVPTPALGT